LIDRGLFFFIGEPGALTHYVHEDNVVAALIRCGRGNTSGASVYNLSDDCPLERFVAEIAGALGKPRPTLRVPERPARWLARALGPIPGLPLNEKRLSALVNRASFPIARARDDLGYTHCVPVEAGIRALAQVWQGSRCTRSAWSWLTPSRPARSSWIRSARSARCTTSALPRAMTSRNC